MPEQSRKQAISPVEKVFIGIGHAAKEVAHKQERGILWVINKHIIPHLPPEQQKKAKLNKARIELFAKRAGIGLTAGEIIVATVLSAKAIRLLHDRIRSRSPRQEVVRGNGSKQIEKEFAVDPYASEAKKITQIITRPAQQAKQIVKEAKQFAEIKPSIRSFKPETFPVSTTFHTLGSTKVFGASGGATDFVSHPSHYLFPGNDQFDWSLPRERIAEMATYRMNAPLIHMDRVGKIGKAMRLTESQFKRGINNRPFWHSEILQPAAYDDVLLALERGLPALSGAIDSPLTILTDSQPFADEMANILSQTPQPWKIIGHGLDNVQADVLLHKVGDMWLRTRPETFASLQTGRHLWDPGNAQFRADSLPRLASLLDAYISKIQSARGGILLVVSPSHHLVPEWRTPEQDALFMQSWYAFMIPLFRKLKTMGPEDPFTYELPGFSTSPVLDRTIRFFQPSERQALDRFSGRHVFVADTPQTPRANKLLAVLTDSITSDRLESINNWRKNVFGDASILKG